MDGTTDSIFNLPALLIGCSALLLCLAMQGSTVVLVMTVFKSRIRGMAGQNRNVAAHVFFFGAILILLVSHLVQISIWGWFVYLAGILPSSHSSMLLAGSTYTTVGFANDTLPFKWQLLAIIMAVTGLFAFAWSTSIMYALSQQLYRAED